MKARLINNQLQYASNFEKIGDNWVSNPTNEQLIEAGFKEVIFSEVEEVTELFSENDNEIISYIAKTDSNVDY